MSDLQNYDYELPPHLVAQQPLANRVDARLLVVNRGTGELVHSHVRDIAEHLAPGDCLVVNDTRVVPARLVGFRTETSGRWEGLFLAADERHNWRILSKTRGKLTPGETITLVDPQAQPTARLKPLIKEAEGVWVVRPESSEETFQLLERIGRIPLPHYIRGGEMVDSDRARYQTVFAANPGAVAAPTAGLHFTQDLLGRLQGQGIAVARVTLHVGIDTFRPIMVDTLSDHPMHCEWGRITAADVETIRKTKQSGGRVVAVGTTSVRVLETACAGGALEPWSGETRLFIRPPYEFRTVDALMTNFHLPRTTLMVLVQTFGGDELIRRAYEAAIEQEYRFYSYGDAMLIL